CRSRGQNCRHVRERIPDRMPDPPAESAEPPGDRVQGAFPSTVVSRGVEGWRAEAGGVEPPPQLGLGHGAKRTLRGLLRLPPYFRDGEHGVRLTLGVEDEVPAAVVPGGLLLQGRGDPLPPVLVLEAPHGLMTSSSGPLVESVAWALHRGRRRRGRAEV